MTIIVALTATLVLLVLGILVAVLVRRRRRQEEEKETNYRVFFMMGIAMVPIGAALMIASLFVDVDLFFTAMPFLTIGLVYVSLGLANRHKWQRTSPSG